MENNEMDESRIKQIVREAIAPLSTKVDALEADVQSLKGDMGTLKGEVHGLRNWTIATSLTSVGLVLALLAYATSVFSNHMQTLQLLMTAMQLPAN
ncbi:MAG: hypothetical protein OXU83_05580 [Gammaproteobacteria bacterium]|nr:hypothetical protein [Gammaproteobacteria bacterium]